MSARFYFDDQEPYGVSPRWTFYSATRMLNVADLKLIIAEAQLLLYQAGELNTISKEAPQQQAQRSAFG